MIIKKQDQQARDWHTIIDIGNLTVNIFSYYDHSNETSSTTATYQKKKK